MKALPLLSFDPVDTEQPVDLDALLEFALFVYGVTRSGKTNFNRWVLEQTYGRVQQLVIDADGEYATLRTKDRPYLIVGPGRDVDLPRDRAAVMTLVDGILAHGVSTIFDIHDLDDEPPAREQSVVVRAICDTLVRLPERSPKNVLLVLEELQEWAPQNGDAMSALSAVRRLAKRGLKRGVTIVGSTQRVSDVSKGVTTQLKSKAIGGTDADDVVRALKELGLPASDRAAVMDLPQGHFQVKGPAFARHALHVRVPLAETSPPKRRRGDPPAPAAEAPAAIAKLARELARLAESSNDRAARDAAPLGRPVRGDAGSTPVSAKGIGLTRKQIDDYHAAERGKPRIPEERDVKESEAKALREENEQLRQRLEALESGQPKRFGAGDNAPKRLGAPDPSDREVPIGMLSDGSAEALYQTIKQRLVKEAPALLRVLTVKPQIDVEVQRKTITADGSTWVGRVAQLVAEGFFDEARKSGVVFKEAARRGALGIPARADEACKKLLDMRFLTREVEGFQAVKGMKVNIVER